MRELVKRHLILTAVVLSFIVTFTWGFHKGASSHFEGKTVCMYKGDTVECVNLKSLSGNITY